MPARDFRQIEQDLDQAVEKLKETDDPKLRRNLLLELRLLLTEADCVLREPTE